jgi:hypothetical protein
MIYYNNSKNYGYLEFNGITDIDELTIELLRNLIIMITEENNIILVDNNFFIDDENNLIPYLYDKLYEKIRQKAMASIILKYLQIFFQSSLDVIALGY